MNKKYILLTLVTLLGLSSGQAMAACDAGFIASSGDGVSCGTLANAKESTSVALGSFATSTGNGSIAIGSGSQSTVFSGIAIGASARMDTGHSGIAIGTAAGLYAKPTTSVTIGESGSEKELTKQGTGETEGYVVTKSNELSVEDIIKKYDAGYSSIAVGNHAKAYGVAANAQGLFAMAMGHGTISIGASSLAGNDNAVALGDHANANGRNALSLGANSQAATAYATAVGTLSKATGERAIAVGVNSQSSGKYATAIGVDSKALQERSIALGTTAKADAVKATALGDQASATHANSVALGAGSETTQENSVSVGTKDNTRTITNVTAGEADTDAVNVSQLKTYVADYVTNSGASSIAPQLTQINNQLGNLDRAINKNRKISSRGIASIAAMANIPVPAIRGKTTIGAGVGYYDGQGAISVGAARYFDNGISVKASVGLTNSSKGTLGGGISYTW